MLWRNLVRRIVQALFSLVFVIAYGWSLASELDRLVVGVSTHFAQRRGVPTVDIRHIQDIGFNSFRDEVYWASVEVTKGVLSVPQELGQYDEMITLSKDINVRPLVILSYGNPHHTPDGMPVDAAGREAFARYAEFVANRYRTRVLGFEIWNEWNKGAGGRRPGRRSDVESYWALVSEVAPRLRLIDPSARIVVGAVAGRDLDWIRELATSPGFEEMVDGISIHPYNFCDGSRSRPEDVLNWLGQLEAELIRTVGRTVPIYVTEVGWPTYAHRCGTEPEVAAAYFARLILAAPSVASLEGLYFYGYRDKGRDPYNREHNFGLISYEGASKPAVQAISEALAVLGEGDFVSLRKFGDTSVASYRRVDGSVISAAWSRSGKERTVRISMDCVDTYRGRRFDTSRSADGMALFDTVSEWHPCSDEITLGGRPVYFSGFFADVVSVREADEVWRPH